MSASQAMRAVGVSRETIERANAIVDMAVRAACSEADIPPDMLDRIAAKATELARQELHALLWGAYKDGVARGSAA